MPMIVPCPQVRQGGPRGDAVFPPQVLPHPAAGLGVGGKCVFILFIFWVVWYHPPRHYVLNDRVYTQIVWFLMTTSPNE